MPATEQTWRDQKRMHALFAVSGGVLLLSTVWMFAADHDREWKDYQITARNVDLKVNEMRQLQENSDANRERQAQLDWQVFVQQSQPLSGDLLEEFKQAVEQDAERRGESAPDFSSIEEMAATLNGDSEGEQATGRLGLAQVAADVRDDPEASAAEREQATLQAAQQREQILDDLRGYLRDAKFREDKLLRDRKFKRANFDKERADLDIAVRDNLPADEMERQQAAVTAVDQEVAELSLKYEAASAHRAKLDELLKKMTSDEDQAKKEAEENESELASLRRAYEEQRSNYIEFYGIVPLPGKKILELPILDAFNSPLKIDNLWSEGLEQDYNFRDVRRFDRCTTCHKAIDKTAPGTADKPAFAAERLVTLRLDLTPPAAEEGEPSESSGEAETLSLESFFGIQLANVGLVNRDAPTIAMVRRNSIAAKAEIVHDGASSGQQLGEEIRAGLLQSHRLDSEDNVPGLMMGDVIDEINGDPLYTAAAVKEYLLAAAADAQGQNADDEAAPKSLLVRVRRGLPHPYASHPRLDLYVGSLSPHKMADFACTVCHEGQGSATAFKWASHTPNDERQRARWSQEHGWFDNHHWIYPMYPQRFAESACLKCHHEVTELEPSERFPQPPAPKLMHGYNLIRKYGCYGCHEINGFDGPNKRVGPDMRLEPNYSAAALQLMSLPGFDQLSAETQNWTHELAHHPELDQVRHRLDDAIAADASAATPVLPSEAHGKIAALLKDVETPGSLRKAGPSLRYVASKLDPEFLYDWLHNPQSFRPSTRMPRFFGLWDHLQAEPLALAKAQQLEPMEILGVETYLLHYSQSYDYAERPEGIAESTSEEMAARGKVEFQNRCVACHSHKAFADAEQYREPDAIVQGPDLSAVGDKFAADRNPRGRDWLYSWIKNPSRYNARTLMPDLFLDPVQHKDKDGNVTSVTDPIADIVEFLLADSTSDWTPVEDSAMVAGGELHLENEGRRAALNDMATEYLRDAFFEVKAQEYLKYGVPERDREGLKSAENELVVSDASYDAQTPITDKQKLLYIGRKTIAKYGCYGCHDVPGFEDAKPIGTGLADWGRKESSKLAFEHITHYLEGHGGGHGAAHGSHGNEESHDHQADVESAEDAAFYLHQIQGLHRDGFIYQKLREPRSYDYHKTENKKYNERLRMPQFPFNAAEREAVVTFVLGLIADPPTPKYVFSPDPRQQAIVEGRQVLDKYNCGACHLLETNKWNLAVDPGEFGEQLTPTLRNEIYPFLLTHHTPSELEASMEQDRRGLVNATIEGMPSLENDGQPRIYDDDEGFPGDPLEPDEEYSTNRLHYAVDLWKPTIINGHPYEVGVAAVNVSAQSIESRYPARGGMLARYLLPHVVEREQEVNPAAKGAESWGWVPPPLVGEGAKVQSDWLHDFLLEPHPIRPAVVLRMPKFNMSSEEAAKLARYFAAVDNVQYPYQFSGRRQASVLDEKEQQYEQRVEELGAGTAAVPHNRFDAALKIAVDKNYCRQCHIIADFEPAGAERAKAPNLSQVYMRLRPEYVRDWIARPGSILPYTNMPINIPFKQDQDHLGGVSQQLYPGTSVDQLDGLVDWLMNYDKYAKERTLIAPLVGPDPPATETAPAAAATGGAADASP